MVLNKSEINGKQREQKNDEKNIEKDPEVKETLEDERKSKKLLEERERRRLS